MKRFLVVLVAVAITATACLAPAEPTAQPTAAAAQTTSAPAANQPAAPCPSGQAFYNGNCYAVPPAIATAAAQQAPAAPSKPAAAAQQASSSTSGFRTPYTTQPSAIQSQRQHVGENIFQGFQIDWNSVAPLQSDEWFALNGDVDDTGTCKTLVVKSGKPRAGHGTYQAWRIRGPSDQALNDAVAVLQQIAERESTPCPAVYQ